MKSVIIGVILILIGFISICYAGIMQMVLSYNLYGIFLNTDAIIIPHISLLGYLGIIPLSIGRVMLN